MSVDWKAMFKKYAEIVGRNEGVYFLDSYEWTDDEWDALVDLLGLETKEAEAARLAAALAKHEKIDRDVKARLARERAWHDDLIRGRALDPSYDPPPLPAMWDESV